MLAMVWARPMLAGLLLMAALVVLPAAVLLTAGREPTASIPPPAGRLDGCVMFCTDSGAEEGGR